MISKSIRQGGAAALLAVAAAAGAQQDDGGAARDLLLALAGPWHGMAQPTPIGELAYDIDFKWISEDCLTGVATPAGTPHHWTLCVDGDRVGLEFLSEFRGNTRPVSFAPAQPAHGGAAFASTSHPIVSVEVQSHERSATLTVRHRGEVHVHVELRRAPDGW